MVQVAGKKGMALTVSSNLARSRSNARQQSSHITGMWAQNASADRGSRNGLQEGIMSDGNDASFIRRSSDQHEFLCCSRRRVERKWEAQQALMSCRVPGISMGHGSQVKKGASLSLGKSQDRQLPRRSVHTRASFVHVICSNCGIQVGEFTKRRRREASRRLRGQSPEGHGLPVCGKSTTIYKTIIRVKRNHAPPKEQKYDDAADAVRRTPHGDPQFVQVFYRMGF